MKSIKYSLILIVGFLLLAVSCGKDNPQVPGDEPGTPSQQEFSLLAGLEEHEGDSRTILRSPRVNWVRDDKIKVFDAGGYGKVFGTAQSDVQRAEFRCGGYWEGGTPDMAVHSLAVSIADCAIEGEGDNYKYTAFLNYKQRIVNMFSYAKDASVSIGKVTEEGGKYQIENMQNMFSLFGFKLKSPYVKEVTLRGVNGETLAGWVKIRYRSGDGSGKSLWTAHPSKSTYDFIRVTAAGSASDSTKAPGVNCFKPNSYYYVSVLFQNFDNGIYLDLTNAQEVTIRRKISKMANNDPVYFNRNYRHQLSTPLDDGVVIADEDLTLTLDFSTTWPFNEDCVRKGIQNKTGLAGETYTFTQDAQTYDFEIANRALVDESESSDIFYSWDGSNCLRFNNPTAADSQQNSNGSWIKLPSIAGRMLHTVKVYSNNLSGTRYLALNTAPGVSGAFDTITVPCGSSGSVTDKSLNYDTSYYLVLTGADRLKMSRIELTYGKF